MSYAALYFKVFYHKAVCSGIKTGSLTSVSWYMYISVCTSPFQIMSQDFIIVINLYVPLCLWSDIVFCCLRGCRRHTGPTVGCQTDHRYRRPLYHNAYCIGHTYLKVCFSTNLLASRTRFSPVSQRPRQPWGVGGRRWSPRKTCLPCGLALLQTSGVKLNRLAYPWGQARIDVFSWISRPDDVRSNVSLQWKQRVRVVKGSAIPSSCLQRVLRHYPSFPNIQHSRWSNPLMAAGHPGGRIHSKPRGELSPIQTPIIHFTPLGGLTLAGLATTLSLARPLETRGRPPNGTIRGDGVRSGTWVEK